nr:hypothetical protein [Tanacetum cinerariifolium]
KSFDEDDASRQRRNIADIDADTETILVEETAKDQGRYDDQEMFDTYVLNDEEVVVKDITCVTTTVVSIGDITLAQALVEIKTSKPKARGIIMQEPSETPTTTIPISSKVQDNGKGIMVEEPLKMKKKDQISFDEQEARRLQAEIDEQDRLAEEMEKLRRAEKKTSNQSSKEELNAFNKTIRWINSFVPMESEVVKDRTVLTQENSSKRAGDKLDQGRSKKQKVEDDKEQEEPKRCLEISLDDGDDVTIDATPLSIKTSIIDYKIYKEGKRFTSKFSE